MSFITGVGLASYGRQAGPFFAKKTWRDSVIRGRSEDRAWNGYSEPGLLGPRFARSRESHPGMTKTLELFLNARRTRCWR